MSKDLSNVDPRSTKKVTFPGRGNATFEGLVSYLAHIHELEIGFVEALE
ncbi:hypothetical protein IWX62_002872 [Arthrobacter sp. CAN_A1]